MLMLRISGLFAEGGEVFHDIYCTRRRGNNQLSGYGSPGKVNIAGARFQGLKEDQGRKGAMLVELWSCQRR